MKVSGAIVALAAILGLAGCVGVPPRGARVVPPDTSNAAGARPGDVSATAIGAADAGQATATSAPAEALPVAEMRVPGGEGQPASAAREEAPERTPVGTLPASQYTILVESQPSGATVVIDGIPVGRAPRRVAVAGTALGFFRDPMSIKVRFVATDPNGMSHTVEEALTPRDRIPEALIFTPLGSQRRLR